MGYLIGLMVTLIASFFTGYIMWKCVLGFLLSLIPATAVYAWIGKLICVIAVGYFGGIALPLIVLIIGVNITLFLNK